MEIDKINVGMYVRTPYGIDKIKDIVLNGNLYEDSGLYLEKGIKLVCGKEELKNLKTSDNIIDLIEPQDLMYVDISPDDCGGIVVPRVAETMNELNYWKKLLRNGECILKGVVTREQLSNNVFKVGE